MRRLLLLAVCLSCVPLCAPVWAQQADEPASITVRSNLVVVPALVRTKSGELVFTLEAKDFTLLDNGVAQRLRLEEDTGAQPLALVIVVETGASGATHLEDYRSLSPLLDTLVGAVDHKLALVGYDAKPTLLHGFTPNTSFIEKSLDDLANDPAPDPAANPDDVRRGATLDAIVYAVGLLRAQPTTYRRAILLFSETLDQGSHTKFDEALHAISDTNTSIYSFSFASTKVQSGKEVRKFGFAGMPPLDPGPEHGCFSREPTYDEDGNLIPFAETRGTQDFDCFAELLPPLRLAKMAAMAARNALRRNISSSVAQLTGGEHYKFSNAKALDKDLFALSNHIPNRYVLSFRPSSPTVGFHSIQLLLPEHIDLKVAARNGYWLDAP